MSGEPGGLPATRWPAVPLGGQGRIIRAAMTGYGP